MWASASTVLASENTATGAQIYTQLCAQCHGIDGKGARSITLSPKPKDLTSSAVQDNLDATLYRKIHEGRDETPMGSWKHALSDEQIYDVIAYLRTLAGDGTPTP
jgi:mono/diheme cytochrome c family protein